MLGISYCKWLKPKHGGPESSFARGCSSNCTSVFIPEPDPDAGVDDDVACAKLLAAGLIVESKSNPRHFYITTKGAKNLQMRLLAGSEQSLEEYHKLPGCCFKLTDH